MFILFGLFFVSGNSVCLGLAFLVGGVVLLGIILVELVTFVGNLGFCLGWLLW